MNELFKTITLIGLFVGIVTSVAVIISVAYPVQYPTYYVGGLEYADESTLIFADGAKFTKNSEPLFVENETESPNVHYNFRWELRNINLPLVKGRTYQIVKSPSLFGSGYYYLEDWKE